MQIYRLSILLVLEFLLLIQNGETRPFRGYKNWQVILCTPSGVTLTTAPTASYYTDMIFSDQPGSVNSAWKQLSHNGFYINGKVNGWYRMTKNQSEYRNLSRGDKINYCRGAATTGGYTFKPDTGVMYVTYPDFDLFGSVGYAFFAYNSPVSAYMHEVGHGLGFEHSFTANYGYKNADWSAPGEYGNAWDTMSWAATFSTPTPTNPTKWGDWGPGLDAYHLDRMGWVPRSRILRFGANGVYTSTVSLAPLSAPQKAGYLMVRIPIDKDDLFKYLTVEYRVKQAGTLDAGLPSNKVLINEVRLRNDSGTLRYNSYLIMENNVGPFDSSKPASSLSANYTKIELISTDLNGALIRITSSLPKRCLQGYVWREATQDDYTCVTVATRTATRNDNTKQAGRRDTSGGCLVGWVKRRATAGDQACVASGVALQVVRDNYQASARVEKAFGEAMRNAYGPNTCKVGYVWRQADNSDWVCVPPSVRTQVATDNAQASTRWVSGAYGPKTCKMGYVWRQAFPQDKVCVTPSIRSATRNDNLESSNRLVKPNA